MKTTRHILCASVALGLLACAAPGVHGAEVKKKAEPPKAAAAPKAPPKYYYAWVYFLTTESRIPRRYLIRFTKKPTDENFISAVDPNFKLKIGGMDMMVDRASTGSSGPLP